MFWRVSEEKAYQDKARSGSVLASPRLCEATTTDTGKDEVSKRRRISAAAFRQWNIIESPIYEQLVPNSRVKWDARVSLLH